MESRRPSRQKAEKHRFPTGWGGFRIFHRQPPAARAAATPAGVGEFPAAEGTGALLCGGFPPLLHSDRAAKPPAGVRRNGVFSLFFRPWERQEARAPGFPQFPQALLLLRKNNSILSVLFVSYARTRKQAHTQTSARANKRTRKKKGPDTDLRPARPGGGPVCLILLF